MYLPSWVHVAYLRPGDHDVSSSERCETQAPTAALDDTYLSVTGEFQQAVKRQAFCGMVDQDSPRRGPMDPLVLSRSAAPTRTRGK